MLNKLNSNQRLGIGAVCAVLLIALIVGLWPRGSRETLVIVDGEPYTIISYGRTDVLVGEEQKLEGYLITLTYNDPNRGMTRGTIVVPTNGIREDPSIPARTVIWDPPVTLEGKTYRVARWNPGYKLPARESLPIIPEDPLTRRESN